MHSFYKPGGINEIEKQLSAFLATQDVTMNDIDLVITGKNGDATGDAVYDQLQQSVLSNSQCINYKHLCGEYPTSVSFALWMAANILKTGTVPEVFGYGGSKEIKKILIYNHYQLKHHSLLLVSGIS
jgi:hypothetical protein